MNETDEIDSRLNRALERAPEVAIPAGFAARVATKAPAGARVVRRQIVARHQGSRVAVTAVVVLLMVAIFWLARAGGAMAWLEVGLAIEFAGLTAWLGLRGVMEL